MKDKVAEIVKKYNKDKSQLVSILQDIQSEYNYLPREALDKLSKKLDIPQSHVYSMATFFKAFSLKERGKHVINVCLGTACHVLGSANVLDKFATNLNIGRGETTKDSKFTLETVNCIGACALGPVVKIDGEYYGQMTSDKVDNLLSQF